MKGDKTIIVLAAIGISILIGITATAFALRRATTASSEALAASMRAKAAAVAAHRGLCELKQGYQHQLAQTIHFVTHPDSIPGLRIPKSVLLQSEASLRARIHDLKDVTCP